MQKTAAKLMKKDVVTAEPEMSLEDLSKLLDEEEVHGVPVIDKKGVPIGVVSRTDIARVIVEELEGTVPPSPFYQGDYDEPLAQDFRPPRAEKIDLYKKVRDIMSDHVVTALEAATTPELAALMVREKIHRVLVTRKRKLVGIVSSTDLLQHLAEQAEPAGKGLSCALES